MDPARLDLRLLAVVEAVHRLGSLTAASEALGLTQPAVSHALTRLRGLFGDELFVRTSRGMRPTPRGEEIADSVRRIAALARAELGAPTRFAPAELRRTFRFCMSDVGELVFLPGLVQRLRAEAPGCDVATISLPPKRLAEALEDGAVDLAIGYFPDLDEVAGLDRMRLFERGFLCLASRDHPRLRGPRIALQAYLRESHVVVRSEGRVEERFERFLKEHGLKRHVQLSVPHMLGIPTVVARSDLIATVPHSAAMSFVEYSGIRAVALAADAPLISTAQHWSRRFTAEPVNRWLRAMVQELFEERAPGGAAPSTGGRKGRPRRAGR